ncbi:hypothetical protein V5799_010326 [Amblyomma americanum]|uniref:Transmembrane protein n=1 Tax=Amblyomma americanum TaxID=6943 RepID=A0AAQ4F7Z4_AMBAM
MSIVMVGPFPGPFNRTHYSDSSSEDEPQPPYAEAEYAVPEQCSHYMPPDDVAYRTPQPDPAVPLQLPMYQERPPALPAPLPKPRSVALAQRMWKAKLCRVGAVAAMMAVVALVALAVTAPGEEQPQVAPVKPVNASKAANITQSKGATGPRRQSSRKAPPSTIRTSPHTEEDLAGHSVDVVAGLAEQTPREDSRKRDLSSLSQYKELIQ